MASTGFIVTTAQSPSSPYASLGASYSSTGAMPGSFIFKRLQSPVSLILTNLRCLHEAAEPCDSDLDQPVV